EMNRPFPVVVLTSALTVAFTAAVGLLIFEARGQAPQATADPYANNANAGVLRFPLAAPAGKDSGAKSQAPPSAVNQGPLDPATWKYGHDFDAPPNSKIWNPVM